MSRAAEPPQYLPCVGVVEWLADDPAPESDDRVGGDDNRGRGSCGDLLRLGGGEAYGFFRRVGPVVELLVELGRQHVKVIAHFRQEFRPSW